jgi:hypothetical protein
MAVYIAVKVLPPTDTKGKRISCYSKSKGQKVFPWNYNKETIGNLEEAAFLFALYLLAKSGFLVGCPASLDAIVSIKTGVPVGYVWE